MTVKEFFEVLIDTEFECRRNSYSLNGIFKGEYSTSSFNFNHFGNYNYGGWGGGQRYMIIIEREYKVIKEYKSIESLLKDEEVLQMEIIKVKKIKLVNDYYETSTGNKYRDNYSKFEICVR